MLIPPESGGLKGAELDKAAELARMWRWEAWGMVGEADKRRGGERQRGESVFAVSPSVCERRDHERCFSCFYIQTLTLSPTFILLVSI